MNIKSETLAARVLRDTDGWGANVVFEATGSPLAAATVFDPLCPGGCIVLIGGQSEPIQYDAGAAMVREARVENIFPVRACISTLCFDGELGIDRC